MEQTSSALPAPMRAGGRATEAGMAFQAEVATWFAVHILTRMPVGGRFGINNQALPIAIRLETGEGLDDIEVTQSDGGALHIQCKTSATLGLGPRAPLSKTVGQLVRWVADAKAMGGLPDLSRNVALFAVHADAARTLDTLESACRAFDLGGAWAVTRTQRNQAEREALDKFEAIASPAWSEYRGAAPGDGDLSDLVRIFRISRFSMDEGHSNWREASQLLGRFLFGGDAAGEAPLRDLKGIMRDLIANGAPADRDGLLRALRRRGHVDVGAPGFEPDIAKLRTATASELTRLASHGQLPVGDGVPITRESDAPLLAAIMSGSLLVVGEPGGGKTGALIHAAATIAAAGDTVVFLSLDRFPGVTMASQLTSELGLTHPLVETLAAMPGVGQKILFIDALDAARGAPAEGVFAALIEDVRKQLAVEWIVIASIRTFDLRNGRRYKKTFLGEPANAGFAESSLSNVRHFLIPRLSEVDLAAVGIASSELGVLLNSAPRPLAELLCNIFNLSLAAELLADGTAPESFRAIRTQSGLIDVYEDARLNTTQLQQAATTAVRTMISGQRLVVRKVSVEHAALDAVIQTGVLTATGDLVSFAHHVLFDHVASRFHLAWDDPEALLAQIAGDASTALLLAPALRFAIERIWRFDQVGRPTSWKLISGIYGTSTINPVLGSMALRIAVENIEVESDVAGLMALTATASKEPGFASLLARLARFAKMVSESVKVIATPTAIAWGQLANALLASKEQALLDPARYLLHTLIDHGDLEDPKLLAEFGQAARALLEVGWTTSSSHIADSAIRFVGRSFASDPVASRTLLDRVLREPHFSKHADREAIRLAGEIVPITRADPEFSVEIYAALYSQQITDDAPTALGGQHSRIMPLTSNRRQNYEHCRYQLGAAMGEVLAISPEHGTRALIEALIGTVAIRSRGGNFAAELIDIGNSMLELRGLFTEFRAWDQQESHPAKEDLLHHYVRFLRECNVATFRLCVTAASRDYATASVWTRIFGVGSERISELGDLLWPLIERPDFLENRFTSRAAAQFLNAAWTSRTQEERVTFETMALDATRFTDTERLHQWHRVLGHILAPMPPETLELEAMRTLQNSLTTRELLINDEPYRPQVAWVDTEDYELEQLRRAGVDTNAGPHREVLDASNALYACVQRTSSDSLAPELVLLWDEAMALLTLIDANPDLHDQVDRPAWGHLACAVERVASSSSFMPGADGLPDIETLIAVLDRLSTSRYPEPNETES